MHSTIRAAFCCLTVLSAFHQPAITSAQTNPFMKGQVADRIRKVGIHPSLRESHSR